MAVVPSQTSTRDLAVKINRTWIGQYLVGQLGQIQFRDDGVSIKSVEAPHWVWYEFRVAIPVTNDTIPYLFYEQAEQLGQRLLSKGVAELELSCLLKVSLSDSHLFPQGKKTNRVNPALLFPYITQESKFDGFRWQNKRGVTVFP